MFEGNPEQSDECIVEPLAGPAAETQVFCGHEYTAANLRFALTVEPANQAPPSSIRESVNHAFSAGGDPSLPSTLGLEVQVNPFFALQTNSSVRAAAEAHAGSTPLPRRLRVFGVVRAWKDQFR